MMKALSIKLLIATLFILSCKADKNTTAATAVSKVQEVTTQEVSSQANLSNADLQKFGIDTNAKNSLGGLQVGDRAPLYILNDQRGNPVDLGKNLVEFPVVLTFFRGHWCGYCTEALSDMNNRLQDLLPETIVRVHAVSPESSEYTDPMAGKYGLRAAILHDKDHEVMKAYKVFYETTDEYEAKVKNYNGKDLVDFSGHQNAALPIPATFVIGKDGIIKFVHYNPDYSKRVDLDALMAYFES